MRKAVLGDAMPTRRDFLIGSTLLTTAFVGALAAPKAKRRPLGEVQDELRKLIPDSMRRHNVPGLSLALARERKIVWAEAFGLRDVDNKSPLTPDTVFEAASLGKPAFAYAVLKLVEQGKLNLKRPLVEYIHNDPNPSDARFRQITLWHLLTHTSGIPPSPPKGQPPKLEFTPGERFQYSPHGFDYLQRAVELATGETIVPMMQRMMFRPFGMRSSTFGWSEEYAKSGARGYDAKGEHKQTFDERVWRMSAEERQKFLTPYPLESVPSAAGSLHSTPSDYARFMIEVTRPARDGFHLSAAMINNMLSPHARVPQSDALFWGLGFGLQRPSSGPESFWHWGDWGIFQHYAVADRDDGSALVAMTNSSGLLACRDVAVQALGREQPAIQWLKS